MSDPQTHDVHVFDDDDDDGMPPLVDNPNPPMMFTFAMDMTPITYSADPDQSTFEISPEVEIQSFVHSQDSLGGSPPDARPSHAKKRDASYIPRPPNAFILFRSSFIRDRHVPDKIEGNHSTLSKIIGKYWKTLKPEEREIWETKALVAQAEHRRKYPHWRFRPGANALAKVKDGPPRRRACGRQRGDREADARDEARCTKIAEMLIAGKKGEELEVAIKAFDDCVPRGDPGPISPVESGKSDSEIEVGGAISADEGGSEFGGSDGMDGALAPELVLEAKVGGNGRSRSPAPLDGRFKIPLTAMFKRSSSAPASFTRASIPTSADLHLFLEHVSVPGVANVSESTPDPRGFEGLASSTSYVTDQATTFGHPTTFQHKDASRDTPYMGLYEHDTEGSPHSTRYSSPAISLPYQYEDMNNEMYPRHNTDPYCTSFGNDDPNFDSVFPLDILSDTSSSALDWCRSMKDTSMDMVVDFPDSSYSSLTGWAGDVTGSGQSKRNSPRYPFAPLPGDDNTNTNANTYAHMHATVMKNAFDAAESCFPTQTSHPRSGFGFWQNGMDVRSFCASYGGTVNMVEDGGSQRYSDGVHPLDPSHLAFPGFPYGMCASPVDFDDEF